MRQAGGVLQCFCSEFDVFLPFVQLPPVNADLPGREGPWGWASVSLGCRGGGGPWVPDCAPDPWGRVPRSTDRDLHSSPLQGGSWGLASHAGEDAVAAPRGRWELPSFSKTSPRAVCAPGSRRTQTAPWMLAAGPGV